MTAEVIQRLCAAICVAVEDDRYQRFRNFFFVTSTKGIKTVNDCHPQENVFGTLAKNLPQISFDKLDLSDLYLDFGFNLMPKSSDIPVTLCWIKENLRILWDSLGLLTPLIDNLAGLFDIAGLHGFASAALRTKLGIV